MQTKQQVQTHLAPFPKKYSASLRLWHWLSSVAIIALLITVLLDSTVMNTRNNLHTIVNKLKEKGIELSPDQAKAAAKTINKEIWTWHKYIGLGLAALLLFRIILEFFEPDGASLRSRIRKGALYMQQPQSDKKSGRHDLWVKYLYAFFYLTLMVMVITGLILISADLTLFADFTSLKAAKGNIKDIHGFTMYLIIAFIVIHIAGVLRSELRDRSDVVSSMIHGSDQNPAG